MNSVLRKRRMYLWAGLVAVSVMAAGGAYAIVGNSPGTGVRAQPTADELRSRMTELNQAKLAPAPGATLETIVRNVSGKDWSLQSYRNTANEQCVVEFVPGEGRGYGCRPRSTLAGMSPLAMVSWGTRQEPNGDHANWDESWVEGFASPAVATVEVTLTDCTVARVVPTKRDGAFFVVVGSDQMHAGAWPFRLNALDARGSSLAERVVDLTSPNVSGKMIQVPAPKGDCQ